MEILRIMGLVLLVAIPLGLGCVSGFGWFSGRGQSWGRTHARELGIDDEKHEYDK